MTKRKEGPHEAVGRPSKYEPRFCQMIIEAMGRGDSVVQFAASISVAKASIYEWANVHPEFSAALDEGKSKCEALWEGIVKSRSLKKTKESGSDTLLMFYMRSRFRGWSEKTSIEHTGKNGEPISFSDLSEDAIDSRLKALLSKNNIDANEE